jgi:hypothetical protein
LNPNHVYRMELHELPYHYLESSAEKTLPK